jgi:hypothetical protein
MITFFNSLDRKVQYGGTTTAIVFILTFLMVHYVIHRPLTSGEASLLTALVPIAVGWVTAYYTNHFKPVAPRLDPPPKV